jgi:hypothetical protein
MKKCRSCCLFVSFFCVKAIDIRFASDSCTYYERRKVYLCGKITGDDDYRSKFFEAEKKLFEAGFYPVNPAAVVPHDTEWEAAMRLAISLMLQCDGVALLPDWEQSRGAKIEKQLAGDLGLLVMPIKNW